MLAANDVRQSKDPTENLNATGTALAVGGRRILEQCATVADAEKLCKDLKATTTGSVILGDLKGGSVFEVTPERIVFRWAEEGLCLCTNHFLSKELSAGEKCWRYDVLMKYHDHKKLGLADVIEALHAVNQKGATLQTVMFEPAAQRIHVALGKTALSKGPLTTLELKPLFKRDSR